MLLTFMNVVYRNLPSLAFCRSMYKNSVVRDISHKVEKSQSACAHRDIGKFSKPDSPCSNKRFGENGKADAKKQAGTGTETKTDVNHR